MNKENWLSFVCGTQDRLDQITKNKRQWTFHQRRYKKFGFLQFLFKKPISDKKGQNMGSNDGHAMSYLKRKTTFASDKADHGVRGRGRSPESYQVFTN